MPGPSLQLVVMSGVDVGRKIVLEGTMVVGRTEDCDIVLDDGEVSRQHARFTTSQGGAVVEDMGSRNGVFVDGRRVKELELDVGDRIQIGGHELLVTRYSPVPGQVVERQRFEALGRLAAGIAHDFNNMLAVIAASRSVIEDILDSTPGVDPEALDCSKEIGVAAERARVLAARMLAFARSSEVQRETVDLSSICVELAALLRSSIPRSVSIICDVEPGIQVLGNAAELHQVVMNLMLNARDAMPDGGELLVTVTTVPDTMPRTMLLNVSDTGVGIEADVLPNIFEPFFSTKSERGFGLGLATVHEAVLTHGGSVEVSSKVGLGTTFTITLPIAPQSLGAQRVLTRPPPPEGVGARILLVDDEPGVRRSMRRLLTRSGHRVVEARDGREALRLYADAAESFDLVILDYDMPRLDGAQTFTHLRDMDPMACILLCSGHGEVKEAPELRAAGLRGLLKKPHSETDLFKAVAKALAPAQVLASVLAQRETLSGDNSRAGAGIADEPTLGDTVGPEDD